MKITTMLFLFLTLSFGALAQSNINSSSGFYLSTYSPVVNATDGLNAEIGYRFNKNFNSSFRFTGSGFINLGSSFIYRLGDKKKWGVDMNANLYRFAGTSFYPDEVGFGFSPSIFRKIDLSDKWSATPTLRFNSNFVDGSSFTNMDLSVPISFNIFKNSSITVIPSYRISGSAFAQPQFQNQRFSVGISFNF